MRNGQKIMSLLRLEERAIARLGLALQGYGVTYYVDYMGRRYWRFTSTGEDALLVVAGLEVVATGDII